MPEYHLDLKKKYPFLEGVDSLSILLTATIDALVRHVGVSNPVLLAQKTGIIKLLGFG